MSPARGHCGGYEATGASVAFYYYIPNSSLCQPMFNSTKYPYLFIRFGLAVVFFWFGVGKLLNPQYWLNAWVPLWLINFISQHGFNGTQFIYLNGIFEILVGLSLVSNIFIKLFSTLAIFFLIVILTVNGFTEVTVRDIGLISGFLAIIFWPSTQNRF